MIKLSIVWDNIIYWIDYIDNGWEMVEITDSDFEKIKKW